MLVEVAILIHDNFPFLRNRLKRPLKNPLRDRSKELVIPRARLVSAALEHEVTPRARIDSGR